MHLLLCTIAKRTGSSKSCTLDYEIAYQRDMTVTCIVTGRNAEMVSARSQLKTLNIYTYTYSYMFVCTIAIYAPLS